MEILLQQGHIGLDGRERHDAIRRDLGQQEERLQQVEERLSNLEARLVGTDFINLASGTAARKPTRR